jgi:hypothetical protein
MLSRSQARNANMPIPWGNKPSLEFGHGAGESAAGIHLFVTESLVALE